MPLFSLLLKERHKKPPVFFPQTVRFGILNYKIFRDGGRGGLCVDRTYISSMRLSSPVEEDSYLCSLPVVAPYLTQRKDL